MAAKFHDGTPSKLVCKKLVKINIDLSVRPGSALTLQNMKFYVTEQHMNEALIERPVLEALGLHIRDILATAAARHVTLMLSTYPKMLTLPGMAPESHALS